MGVDDARVDLFVFGRDFYIGATRETLENGWCDFEVLGIEQVKAVFGSSYRLGTVWYLAERVTSDELRSFDEHRRQQLWLEAQGPSVARVLVDPIQSVRQLGQIGLGRECAFRTEADAARVLRMAPLTREALVISAKAQFPLVSNVLDEMYDDHKKYLVLPESKIRNVTNGVQLRTSNLADARLLGEENESKWNDYENSKRESELVGDWLSMLSSSDIFRPILDDFRSHKSAEWLKKVREIPQCEPKVLARASHHVRPVLMAIAKGERLARRTRCIDFIAKRLVADAATKIYGEKGPEGTDHSKAVWASAKAKRVYGALLSIGWSLKRQEGSHRTLQRPGWRDFVFTFHDGVEIGPPVLAEVGKSTGLRPDDL